VLVWCRVFCGTWNVNGQPATCDIQPWLSAPFDDLLPDIYAVGSVLSHSCYKICFCRVEARRGDIRLADN